MTHAPHQWQTAAAEAYDRLGGVVVGMPPGSGKTYAAALIARRCARPLVVAPAAVLPQTMRMFREYGVPCVKASEWVSDESDVALPAFASYSWLQRAAQHDFFERYRPTDILMDEFHAVRNVARNSAARRLERYLIAHPEVRVGVFSASLVTDRLRDWAHAFTWALRGGARSAGIPPTRYGVEALEERFAADPAAWAEFRDRLRSIPGVFLDDDGVGAYRGEVRLSVIELEPALTLAEDWSLPDGYLLVSPAQAASVTRMLAWGYWPRVTPRPSETYLEARRAWSRVVQGVVATGAADTEYQVRELRPEAYAAWAAADAAEREGVETPVWDSARGLTEIQRLVALRDRSRRMIVWAYHRALQAKVAEVLGCPHHGPGGLDADGVRLDETTAPLVVASIEACAEGFNAQSFQDCLILEPVSDPEQLRQLIGRVARQGQLSPSVRITFVVNCSVARQALRMAIARAEASGKANPILQLKGIV